MRFLLDNHHGIGDVAMFLCVLVAIKNKFPNAKIDFIIKSDVEKQLVQAIGGVDNYYYYYPLKKSYFQLIKLVLKLRRNKYDYSISHIGVSENKGALLMKAAGVNNSIGAYQKNAKFRYNTEIVIPEEIIRARKNAFLLKAFELNNIEEKGLLSNFKYKTELSSEIGKFAKLKKGIICICIGTGSTMIQNQFIDGKNWGENKWIKLITELTNLNYGIVLLGGKKELDEMSPVFHSLIDINDSIYNLVGKIDLLGSLEVINSANLLIACDTGLAFCAALMNKSVISLLGPSDPQLAQPYGENVHVIYLDYECSPCYGTEKMLNCNERKCMKDISVESVVSAVNMMIGNKNI